LIEVDVDTTAYDSGHIRGAVGWNWQSQLNDGIRRDIPDKKAFAALLSEAGVTPKTTVILYGDNNKLVRRVRVLAAAIVRPHEREVMNGGRAKWVAEGRSLVTDRPSIRPTTYPVPTKLNATLRARRPEVEKALKAKKVGLVDVRSKPEFRRRDHRAARDDGDGAAGGFTSPVRRTSVESGRGPRRDLQVV